MGYSLKIGHYVFVIGIVGAIVAGVISFQQDSTVTNITETIVDEIVTFEALPEAEALNDSYVRYKYKTLFAGHYGGVYVECLRTDKATGGGGYIHPYYGYMSASRPWWNWDSAARDYQAYAWASYFKNTSRYNIVMYAYVICDKQ